MRRMASVLTAMAVLLVFSGIGQAQDRKGETPLTVPGVKELKAEDLKKMIDKKEKIVVVDSRIVSEYKEAHIPGAINVPEKDMEKEKDKLPKDKGAAVAFYCNGAKCWKSYDAAVKAVAMGYKNVYRLRLGIPEWKEKGFPTE